MTAVSATTLNSPAVASALKAVAAAIEEEVVRNTPKKGSSAKGSSSEKADELVGSLQAEIAALKQKLAEAEKRAEDAQPQNPLAALFKCITCGLPEKWAAEAAVRLAEEKKALRLEVEPQVRAKLKKVLEGASVKIKDTTPILETGLSSLDFLAMNKMLAEESDMDEEVLMAKVPVVAGMTAAQLLEQLTAVVTEHTVEKQMRERAGGGGDDAADKAADQAREDAKAADDLEATAPTAPTAPAPTVAKVTPAELLENAQLAHLTESAFGEWAECLKVTAEGRTPLLTYLKDHGVAKLPERQKLATALAKAKREGSI